MQDIIKEPITRNAKNTFNAIFDAAVDLFYKNGYHGTTVNNITSEAGVAAGTFYLYFPSKLALYKHILLTFSHNIRKEIAEKVSLVNNRRDKEKEGIKTFINLARKNPQMYNIIWESLYIDRELFKEYYESFAKRYVKGLNFSIQLEEVRPIDTEVISFVLMGITNFIGLKVVLDLGANNDDVDYIVDQVMDLLEHGLFAKNDE
ncbi:TetR/AcrR family transcriptional regulator [Liberiplasma polymorphum]|uniref:TetR/AcrR family transcriptional regulator n=1 Tax=Liberiplasma polymorphum TaxID=3374570 RepID=UPI003774791F